MIGIVSYGVYIPRYRMARELIAQTWGRPGAKGERAVANYDEDSLTMATETVLNCLQGIDPGTVDGLYFGESPVSPPIRGI
ncbi:unnamed protein product [marine sediment metagenome]|uniref:Hydroxymethylglutaryl-coenzyme A synthase N-terminal domain-containing protein n=1 Tax=marine sediment metagenome TaxID=412755 RepID=X1NGX1_9ZZZZ